MMLNLILVSRFYVAGRSRTNMFLQLDATDILFPYALWIQYLNLTGAVDHGDGHGYTLTLEQYQALQPLKLTLRCIKCVNVTLIPDAQILPRNSSSAPIRLAIQVRVKSSGLRSSIYLVYLERRILLANHRPRKHFLGALLSDHQCRVLIVFSLFNI